MRRGANRLNVRRTDSRPVAGQTVGELRCPPGGGRPQDTQQSVAQCRANRRSVAPFRLPRGGQEIEGEQGYEGRESGQDQRQCHKLRHFEKIPRPKGRAAYCATTGPSTCLANLCGQLVAAGPAWVTPWASVGRFKRRIGRCPASEKSFPAKGAGGWALLRAFTSLSGRMLPTDPAPAAQTADS